MIEVYKILNGVYDSRVTSVMLSVSGQSRTRGHSQKLNKYWSRIDIRKFFFTSRVVTMWNSLPECAISAPSVNAFENRISFGLAILFSIIQIWTFSLTRAFS